MIDKLFAGFEKIISATLLLLMAVVVLLSTVELAYLLFIKMTNPPGLFLGLKELFDLFGLFLAVLIAIELMSSIHMYFRDKAIHMEVMFLVAITAVTRKIVILDSKTIEPLWVIGLALLLAALTVGYYLIKKTKNAE